MTRSGSAIFAPAGLYGLSAQRYLDGQYSRCATGYANQCFQRDSQTRKSSDGGTFPLLGFVPSWIHVQGWIENDRP